MAIGFIQIFSSMVDLFGLIYTSGYLLFDWLSTPILETADQEFLPILSEFGAYTPFEIIFGPGLILVLVFCLVKFVMGAIT